MCDGEEEGDNTYMKILIYGAGVIGCELAHMLIKAGNEVTLLARGEWKKILEERGLVIRHAVQLYTTKDYPAVLGQLRSDDVFDLIFVVMQYSQLPAVLPVLAVNKTKHIVFIGNNMNAAETEAALIRNDAGRDVAFGFQGTGGRRENGKVVSVHAGVGMTIGCLHNQVEGKFRDLIRTAFSGVRYRLTWESDMDAWLKCHAALILPIAYVCYAVDCRLPRASKKLISDSIDATKEAFAMIKKLGYGIYPEGMDEYSQEKQGQWFLVLRFLAKTPLGRLAASDHCRHAVIEMQLLDESFEKLRKQSGTDMPAWDRLRAAGYPHEIDAE